MHSWLFFHCHVSFLDETFDATYYGNSQGFSKKSALFGVVPSPETNIALENTGILMVFTMRFGDFLWPC